MVLYTSERIWRWPRDGSPVTLIRPLAPQPEIRVWHTYFFLSLPLFRISYLTRLIPTDTSKPARLAFIHGTLSNVSPFVTRFLATENTSRKAEVKRTKEKGKGAARA